MAVRLINLLLLLFSIQKIFSQDASSLLFSNSLTNSRISHSISIEQRNYATQKKIRNDSILSFIGEWAWGRCHAFAANNDIAYVDNGVWLQILDIATPSIPTILSEYYTGGISDIEIRDSLAFLCAGDSIIIIDIADPKKLNKIGGINISPAIDVLLQDSIAFVRSLFSLHAIDITDIHNLKEIGSLALGENYYYTLFLNKGRIIYLYCGDPIPQPFLIIDANKPDSMKIVASEFTGGIPNQGIVSDSLLIFGNHGLGQKNSIQIYSIADPKNLKLLYKNENGIGANKIAHMDSLIYCVDDTIISVVDISNPVSPVTLKILQNGGHQIIRSGDKLIVQNHPRITTYTIIDSDSVSEFSSMITGDWVLDFSIKDTVAFIATEKGGIWIANIADPRNPKNISNIYLGKVVTHNLQTIGKYLFVLCQAEDIEANRGLWIFDISDVAKPIVVSHYIGFIRNTNTDAPSLFTVSNNTVFISKGFETNDDAVIEVVDISNIFQPKQVNVIHGNFNPYSLTINCNNLYVSTHQSGLKIFDFTDLQSIIEVSSLNLWADNISIMDSYAIIAGDSLYVVDISDNLSLKVLSSLPFPIGSGYRSVSCSNGFAYTATEYKGRSIIDLSDPLHPKTIFSYSDEYTLLYNVKSTMGKVYYAEGSRMTIYKNNIVTRVVSNNNQQMSSNNNMSNNFPNPFNNETTIQVTIPKDDYVKIEIFNSLGEKVCTLQDGLLHGGSYNYSFNGKDYSSGIYFYRLSGRRGAIIRKMIMIK